MAWLAFALVALLAQDVSAQTGSARGADFLRFGCSQLVIERTDPLVNPGVIPSSHMHQVVGGSSFNASVCCTPAYFCFVSFTNDPLDGPCGSRSSGGIAVHIMQDVRGFQQLLDCLHLFPISRERHVQASPTNGEWPFERHFARAGWRTHHILYATFQRYQQESDGNASCK